MLFFVQPVQLNPLDAVLHIHNIAEKENIDVEKMLFTSKLKTSRSSRTKQTERNEIGAQ